MKIAIFSDLFLPQVNGVVTHIIDTIRALAQNHEIVIFVPDPSLKKTPPNLFSSINNIKIIKVPSAPLPIYKQLRITLPHNPFIFDILNKFKPDLIHFHTPGTVAMNGILYAKNKHIPLISTFHGYFMEPEYLAILGLDKFGLHKSKKLNSLLWNYARYFYSMADTIISPSETTKKDLIRHGIKKPIHIISNGIDLASFKRTKKSGPNYILPEKYFLHVGRISKEKSIPDVIAAFAKCKTQISADLVIVGGGPQLEELKTLTLTLSLQDRVHFMGEIHHDKLIRSNIYKKAIAFITASTSESQGIAVLEAIAAKLPIIGVKARALPELITDNGFCCKPHNITSLSSAMISIFNNEDQRKIFSKNSYKQAKKHSLNRTISKLLKLYTKAQSNTTNAVVA